jgi:acetyl-CoA acetyltransferase/uncharacterized OB-fold protein
MRPLPALTPESEEFWTGGEHDELRIPRCADCGEWLHPSQTVCPGCFTANLVHTAVGRGGVVVGFSVNHQPWGNGFDLPYIVAIVELDDAPAVRLTSNLVNLEVADAHVGLAVRAIFEHVDDVWVPLFEPSGQPDQPGHVELPAVDVRPPASSERFEHRSALTGIGMSEVGRRLLRPAASLAVEAALAAVADAGLELSDIDGLSTYPGGLGMGMSEGGIPALEEALRIRPTWFNGGMEIPGQGGAVIAAMLAVSAGLCRHVLCVRTVWEASFAALLKTGRAQPMGGGRASGDQQWRVPYGAVSAATFIGMIAAQYLDRFGADREVLGRIAVNARAGAARNPGAVYRDPMSMDDYYGARMVSTPFGLYDCDVPCDGAVAIVVSAVDTAGDTRHGGVRVDAVGSQITERVSWDQGTLTHEPQVFGPAAHLWSRSALQRTDVDVALLYDGFTFNCVSWLEALGFCGIGEAPDWIGDGSRIALGGELPLNPHGGQLSAGRLHGFGFLHEAVTQLRGDAGERQVEGAEVAVVSTGGGTPGGCFLLTSGR